MYPYKYNTGTYISSVVHMYLFVTFNPTAIRSKLLYLFKSGKRSSRLIKSLVPTCCLTSNLFKNNEIKSLQFIGWVQQILEYLLKPALKVAKTAACRKPRDK